MFDVQQEYEKRMAALSGREKVTRAAVLLKWSRDVIARQILEQKPVLNPEILKWKVAQRVYAAEPAVLALTQQAIDRVSESQNSTDASSILGPETV